MTGNKRNGRLKFSLFPLFPRFQPGRKKSSADISKLKNEEVLKDEGGPSCSQTQKKRKSRRIKIGKGRRILVIPLLKRLKKSFSGFGFLSDRKLSGCFCGCALKRTICKSPNSDDSDPENFSHANIRKLLEKNDFCMNSSIQRRIAEQQLSALNRDGL